jgi:hypothetical protein
MYVATKEYPTFPQDWTLQNFMREDENKKVWNKNKNSDSEQLYYDFSLEVGDTLPNYLGHAVPYPDYLITVVENITYEKMRNGEERKVWHLLTLPSDYRESWIEGMGSDFGVIFPLISELVGASYSLLCYHENKELVYFNSPWGTCYVDNFEGINTYDNQVIIYPNPTQNILYIKTIESMSISDISLIGMQGQIVRQYEPKIQQLDVSDISSGLYFIKFTTNSGEIIQKVII